MSKHSPQDIRYQQFASKVFVEIKSASEAYSEVFGVERNKPSTGSSASRLLRHPKVQIHSGYWSHRYLIDAAEAYRKQWELAEDPATAAAVRSRIYSHILDRAMSLYDKGR